MLSEQNTEQSTQHTCYQSTQLEDRAQLLEVDRAISSKNRVNTSDRAQLSYWQSTLLLLVSYANSIILMLLHAAAVLSARTSSEDQPQLQRTVFSYCYQSTSPTAQHEHQTPIQCYC
jgi:hypothetical protein